MWRWEDVRMWRWEDEKMWRCEDVKMRRCEDVRMWRWENVKMWGCEDEKMWKCENIWQTPTVRRTLRSDVLGKKFQKLFDHVLDEHPYNLEDSKISHAYQVLIYKCSSGLLGTQPILQSVSREKPWRNSNQCSSNSDETAKSGIRWDQTETSSEHSGHTT